MAVRIIYFVHGTTYDNAEAKCSGWKQVDLNELGREQSVELGKTTNYEFDALYASDLIRAVHSAELSWPNIDSVQDTRLRECNYGDYNGGDKKLVVYEDHVEMPFPNGESLKDVEKRMRDFVDFLKENYDGKTIGVVAHRAPQLALDVITKKISWVEAIEKDWRKQKKWQPGWEYVVE